MIFSSCTLFPALYEKVLMVLFRLTIYHEVPSGEIRKVIAEINQHIYFIFNTLYFKLKSSEIRRHV